MANLYELTNWLKALEADENGWAADHDGDLTDWPLEAQLEAAKGEVNEKLLSIGAWIKNIESDAEAIRAEEKALEERRHATEAKADRLRAWVGRLLPAGEKLADARVSYSWRKSEAVEVADVAALPVAYQRVDIAADKKGIKEALKAGQTITGCALVQRLNLVIK